MVTKTQLEEEEGTGLNSGGGGDMTREEVPSRNPDSHGSGRFQDISKYIEANRPQVGTLAADIVSKVGDKATNVRRGLTAENDRFAHELAPEEERLGAGAGTISSALSITWERALLY